MGEVVRQVVPPLVPDDRLHRLAGDEERDEDGDQLGLGLGADAAGDQAGKGWAAERASGSLASLLGAVTNTTSGRPMAPAVNLAVDFQEVAGESAVRSIAEVDFEPDTGHSQVAAGERVGKVQRRQLLVLSRDVFGPRLVEADDGGSAGVEAASDSSMSTVSLRRCSSERSIAPGTFIRPAQFHRWTLPA